MRGSIHENYSMLRVVLLHITSGSKVGRHYPTVETMGCVYILSHVYEAVVRVVY